MTAGTMHLRQADRLEITILVDNHADALVTPGGGPVITPTVRAMEQIRPTYMVPLHCTGWNASRAFADAMPDRFILNTVGTTCVFP